MDATTQAKIAAKMRDFRNDLKQITDALVNQAKEQGREDYSINGLLAESYGITGRKRQTFDEWKDQNYSIIKGEHAHLFWGKPKEGRDGRTWCPVAFLFDESQVRPTAIRATA